MGVQELIVVPDSDDDLPLSEGEKRQHIEAFKAFWNESDKKKKLSGSGNREDGVCVGGSRWQPRGLADTSSTRHDTGRLRMRQDAVGAGGSMQRHHALSDGGLRKRHHSFSDGGSSKRRDAYSHGGSRKMIHKLTESYDVTGSTIVTTVDKEMIREFLESIIPVYTCARGTCSIVVHTLTSTDVNRKQMKLPKRMVPTDLELTGAISVRFPPRVCVTGSYEVLPEDDGRVKMTCWKDFINAVGWKVKTKIVMMFCRCDDHTCLFVSPLDALLLHK